MLHTIVQKFKRLEKTFDIAKDTMKEMAPRIITQESKLKEMKPLVGTLESKVEPTLAGESTD